jgi:hypothetical protein
MGGSATGAATPEKFLFRLRNGQLLRPHIRNRMGKNGRRRVTEGKPTGDRNAKQGAGGASLDRKPLSSFCPAPPDNGLASGAAHSFQKSVGSFSFSIVRLIGDAHLFLQKIKPILYHN